MKAKMKLKHGRADSDFFSTFFFLRSGGFSGAGRGGAFMFFPLRAEILLKHIRAFESRSP